MSKQRFISAFALVCLGLFPTPTFSQTPSQSLGVMDQSEIQRILAGEGQAGPTGADGILLDLNFMRLESASLDNLPFLKYFAALNNCGNPQIGRLLSSEFELPRIAAFYKEKAPSVLNNVPTTIRLEVGTLVLGEYDSSKKAFPIKNEGWSHGQPQQPGFTMDHVDPTPTRTALSVCRPAISFGTNNPIYRIKFKGLNFTELPMDEATARNWVLNSLNGTRQVRLIMDISILPQAPNVMTAPGRPLAVVFDGEIKKLAAVSAGSMRTVSLGSGHVTQEAPQELSILYP